MPQVATLLCILFILFFFWNDHKEKREGVSSAVWIPLIWMFLAGSRYLSQWLNLGMSVDPTDIYNEGSPLDRNVFLLLITSGAFILITRRIRWGRLLTGNKWIWLFYLYCATSILWSDYPFISFKRWIKDLGNLIMVLIIMTEKQPYNAIDIVYKRLAYLLIPLSVLFIRYFPDLGRTYHRGSPLFTGVAGQKNGLGQICLIFGIYFCWKLLLDRKQIYKSSGKKGIWWVLLFISMNAWLLYKSQSATSLVCLSAAIGVIIMGISPFIYGNPKRIILISICSIAVVGFLEATTNLSENVISLLGRDPDLTTRVPIWGELKEMAINHLTGAGFMSFWAGERLTILWEKYGRIIQAHNGYLELYLNLGIIGLVFISGNLISGLLKVTKHLQTDYATALLRLSFIVAVVLYNWAEATFNSINNMWLMLLLGLMEIPKQQSRPPKTAPL